MRIAPAVLALLALAGCDRAPARAVAGDSGARLEVAAVRAGLVPDPRAFDPVGAYVSETDRVCVVRSATGLRIGAAVDYGEQQACVARGTMRGSEALAIALGPDCRFDARFDGDRIVFPATLPGACDRACTGRATLSALTAELLSRSPTEARSMRAPDGRPLCED